MTFDWSINLTTVLSFLGFIFAVGRWVRGLHKENMDRFKKIEERLIAFDHLHDCMDEVKTTVGNWNKIFTEMGIREGMRDSARERRGRK